MFRSGRARGKGKGKDNGARLAAVCCLLAMAALALAGYGTPQSSAPGPGASAAPLGDVGTGTTAWSGLISRSLGVTMEWKTTDLNEDYDPAQAVVVQLQGDRISVSGGSGTGGVGSGATGTGATVGAEAVGSTLRITAAGTYLISGQLHNGQILVDAAGDDKVHLVLDGVTVANDHTAPLYVINADKTIITLAAGTVNTFTDTANYKLEADDDDPKGPVYSKDDLTINGTGTLVVEGNYRHGIVSKDNLKIINATIVVTAVHHGVKGNDMVAIRNANLTIRAGEDGIHSHEPGVGFIYIESGTIDIVAGEDGMQAETTLVIVDGEINIVTGGGSSVSPKRVQEGGPGGQGGGRRPGAMPGGVTPATPTTPTTPTTTTATTVGSYKGLKSRSEIIIHDGRIAVDSRDDSIHADDAITINAGTITVSTGDDGIHADQSIVINGGSITVLECFEGIESSSVTINGGDIRIRARDDGINGANRKMGGAAGGAAQGPGQAPGGFGGGMAAGVHKLFINGGYIFVDADGDGIDVNGTITMTGGFVVVNGPLSQNNGALDFDAGFIISGGTIVASGSSGMAQAPSSA
ncbi:MAG: carbohydrate-binding domain-containing protein [Bacillota bacterium]|nr:carbohydrate-binding domain-containing protein [Bacillota bacterium]